MAIDSKQYRGQLRVDRDGMVWHGRHLLVSALRTTLWEADQADEILGIVDVQVAAIGLWRVHYRGGTAVVSVVLDMH